MLKASIGRRNGAASVPGLAPEPFTPSTNRTVPFDGTTVGLVVGGLVAGGFVVGGFVVGGFVAGGLVAGGFEVGAFVAGGLVAGGFVAGAVAAGEPVVWLVVGRLVS